MRDKERQFWHSLKNGSLPSALWHADGHLADANQPFCDMIGYTPEEIHSGAVNWRLITVPELLEQDSRLVEEVSTSGICRPYEKIFLRRDGNLAPAIVAGGRLNKFRNHTVVFALDISSIEPESDLLNSLRERMLKLSSVVSDMQDELLLHARAEDALQIRRGEFQSLSERMAQARQHECHTAIQLLNETLQQLFASSFDKTVAASRREMRRAAAATTSITRQCLEASRHLAGDLALSILPEAELIPTLKLLAQSFRDRHGIQIELAVSDAVESTSDEIKLAIVQAVRELLTNVVEHSHAKLARVSAGRIGELLQIEVEDSGDGFDPDRVSLQTGSAGGLAAISERVRELEGELQIFSTPGLGTRCKISLPRTTRAERARTVHQGIQTYAGRDDRRKIQVILVDDHTVIRQGIVSLLKVAPDVEIVGEAADGEAAVELARTVRPDVILMDVCMPGMDGVQATRLIHDEMPQVRVIGLSMFEEAEMAFLMREAGAVGYLSKNGPSDAMISAIRASV